jgi:tellurite resistance protein TehA-like permease
MTTTGGSGRTDVLRSERVADGMLPRVLGSSDMGAIFVAIVLIWCLSMIVLFIDVLVILRRYRPQFVARPLARPVVFWVCAALGAVSSLVAIVVTLSGSQTPLITNDAGAITMLGATISYGLWFYLVAGITVASLAIGVVLYLIGRRTEARTTELDYDHAPA